MILKSLICILFAVVGLTLLVLKFRTRERVTFTRKFLFSLILLLAISFFTCHLVSAPVMDLLPLLRVI